MSGGPDKPESGEPPAGGDATSGQGPGGRRWPAAIGRRTFLRRTIAGAALLTLGGTALRHLSGYRLDETMARRLRVLSAKEAIVLAAVARRVLAPDGPGAPSPEEIGVVPAVDEYLRSMPDEAVSDVRALLQLVEHSPFLFTLRPSRFTRLDAPAQDAVLADWESSRLDVRRRGFSALKTLCVLGYYGDPRTFSILGYPGPTLPGR